MDQARVALPLVGGCLCGAVRYSLSAAPVLVHVCHCHDCQKTSGAAFTLTALVISSALTMTGPVETKVRTTARGREVHNSSCSVCGAGLTSSDVARATFTGLRVGTFDDSSWAVPIAQTYVASALPWAIIPGVEQVEPEQFNYGTLSAAWRKTAPAFE